MHVPGIETPPPASEAKTAKQASESSGLFATFMEGAQNFDTNLLRIAGGMNYAPEIRQAPESDQASRPNDAAQRADNNAPDADDDAQSITSARDDDNRQDDEDSDIIAAVNNGLLSKITTPSSGATAKTSETTDGAQSALASASKQGAPTEAAEKTSPANAQSKSGAQADGKAGNISVTQDASPLHSRPTTTLASAATVAAQTDAQSVRGGAPGDNSSATSGNLLLNAAANKGSAQNRAGGQQAGQQQTPQQQTTPAGAPATGVNQPNTNTPIPTASQAAPAAATSTGVTNSARAGQAVTFGDAITAAAGPTTGLTALSRAMPAAPKPPPGAAAQSRATTDQIAVQIRKAVDQGVDKIRIQLRPAELGRVDIKLDIGADGRVMASVTVERPETLELLQRDARGLQQALQDAGLQADSGSLSFSLNGDNADDQPTENTAGGDNQRPEETLTANADDAEAPRRATDGLLDVEV